MNLCVSSMLLVCICMQMFLICIYKYVPVWQCTSVGCMLLMVLLCCLLGVAVVGTELSGGTVAASWHLLTL